MALTDLIFCVRRRWRGQSTVCSRHIICLLQLDMLCNKCGRSIYSCTAIMQINPTLAPVPLLSKLGLHISNPCPYFFFSLSAAKCHQFTLAWGPISSFTANIREMHFSSCYHLTVLISATQGTQYCLHILLHGISTDAKTLPVLWRRRLLSVLWDFLDLWLSQWS